MVQVGTDINDNPVYNVMNEDDKLDYNYNDRS